jgi:hypothetical protein
LEVIEKENIKNKKRVDDIMEIALLYQERLAACIEADNKKK